VIALTFKFGAKFFFRRKHHLVPARKNLLILAQDGIAHDRRIPIVTEDDPYGRVVIRSSLELVHHPDVHVRVPEVLMGYLAGFEVEQDETFEQMVVEDQIHVQVF